MTLSHKEFFMKRKNILLACLTLVLAGVILTGCPRSPNENSSNVEEGSSSAGETVSNATGPFADTHWALTDMEILIFDGTDGFKYGSFSAGVSSYQSGKYVTVKGSNGSYTAKLSFDGISSTDLYKKVAISKQDFSKIISDKGLPEKNLKQKRNRMLLLLGLNKSYDDFLQELASLHFTFSDSDETDLIIQWYVLHKNYDIDAINEELVKRGLAPLGNVI